MTVPVLSLRVNLFCSEKNLNDSYISPLSCNEQRRLQIYIGFIWIDLACSEKKLEDCRMASHRCKKQRCTFEFVLPIYVNAAGLEKKLDYLNIAMFGGKREWSLSKGEDSFVLINRPKNVQHNLSRPDSSLYGSKSEGRASGALEVVLVEKEV
ncbi:uncharacterized protein LDX57_007408 [Aspergillus melleus]|uniref:uncharacterized protein n=1 Tax=Aspergillus melleus TaxID=138277 RepID=UPI001E8D55A7|nr:uncharacterized protein LDX57_007408 [Aspergillus melleus]KAH8429736.1 hypothetical protein LDX57_007408 [Aspergillus melleus]